MSCCNALQRASVCNKRRANAPDRSLRLSCGAEFRRTVVVSATGEPVLEGMGLVTCMGLGSVWVEVSTGGITCEASSVAAQSATELQASAGSLLQASTRAH